MSEMDQPDDRQPLKRKRSADLDTPIAATAPAPKTPRASNHLAINYLARHLPEDVALISTEDNLPTLIASLSEYAGILERHESLALNFGAKPLGPILVRGFEKLFEGPPTILHRSASLKPDSPGVSWLDVVEFARNKPDQFTLSQMSEGVRVCQFYTKQCRVQISEDDFMMLDSGIPQKLIPPQPVLGDEEKELGTIEVLESCLASVIQMADQGTQKAITPRSLTNCCSRCQRSTL
jgi:hypothetical protein